MTTTPAAWHPDPLGRFEQRYWDGTRWTEHVASAGAQITDPNPVPGAEPASSGPVPGTGTDPTGPPAVGPVAAAAPSVPVAPMPAAVGTAHARPAASDVTRQRFGWFMTVLGGLLAITAFLPWLQSGRTDETLSGIEWGFLGWVALVAGVLVALYGSQGIRQAPVRFHGWVTAALVVAFLTASLGAAVADEVDRGTFRVAQVEPGPGLILATLIPLVAIWPLVMLWRDARRRRSAGSTG